MRINQNILKKIYKSIKGTNRYITKYENGIKTTFREYKKDVIEVVIKDGEDEFVSRYDKNGFVIYTTVLSKKK
ncbi:hypothetical protein [Liquorilactobacillus hordei]|uniref:Uncharacterized protein n=1 Tax=Liquorilactobacillus hordei DSM 19519 TaxID=1423759 RepID=A0A0R1MJA6_9LACO|nr:hypothetical protein [Liquorilactobacillus hordei]KRL08014.1 hypothetical protein FC92_GL001087 [Liquorilactobacillus hordei DSM 19519]QYH51039.1 hypothetical protein G6O70_00300 [Liquorilactobacillus hordei DSM 19519]